MVSAFANDALLPVLKTDGNIDVSPHVAFLGEKTVFTVNGANFPTTLAFWNHDCQNLEKLPGATATEVKFSCTPTFLGNKVGVIKDMPGGTVLKDFEIEVKPALGTCNTDSFEPDNSFDNAKEFPLNEIKFHSICDGNDQDFIKFHITEPSAIKVTASGNDIYSSTNLFLYDSNHSLIKNIDINDDFLVLGCDEPLAIGTYYASISSKHLQTEIASYSLSVSASVCRNESGAKVDSIYPLSANFGEETTFTIKGTNLPDTTAFWIHNCANVKK